MSTPVRFTWTEKVDSNFVEGRELLFSLTSVPRVGDHVDLTGPGIRRRVHEVTWIVGPGGVDEVVVDLGV